MYKIKIISAQKKSKLEDEVNRFLKKIKEKLFDIKFTHSYVQQYDIHMYRSFVIYEE